MSFYFSLTTLLLFSSLFPFLFFTFPHSLSSLSSPASSSFLSFLSSSSLPFLFLSPLSFLLGCFGDPVAHSGSVRGIVVDALNQVVATSGADARLAFWNFKTKALLHSVPLATPAALLRLQTNRFESRLGALWMIPPSA